MSACEYDAPKTLLGCPEFWRGVEARPLQKGEDGRLYSVSNE